MASIVVRSNPALESFIQKNPSIKIGKALTGNFIVLYIEDSEVEAVLENLRNTKIDAYSLVLGLMGKEALDSAGITSVHQQPYLDLKGRGVLLGFIDTGIDYTLDAFKYENNTSKIKYIWDQTIEGKGPDDYGFGTEYTGADINRALAAQKPFEIVPHRDNVGHGTFLASVAGSRESGEYIGAAPEAEIIAVKLKSAGKFYRNVFSIPPEEENAFESVDVMLGIEYILERAVALNRPVSICISVGTNLGGHDGFNIFEDYLSRVSHQSRVTVCCAAGNESNAGHHTSGTIAKTGDMQKIEISAGEHAGDIYLTIWTNAADRVSVSVISPTGEMVGRVPAKNGSSVTEHLVLEKSVVMVYYFFPIEESGSQLTVVKILDATPGIWRVQVYGDIIGNGKFDAYLPITGFISPDVKFLLPNPNSTVVVPATAFGVIACGAYNSHDKSLYAASGWGPTRFSMIKPDLIAPGVDVTGTFPTGRGAMAGTSVAAAITAGACALLLQWGIINGNEPVMDTYLARADLIRGCDRDTSSPYPNNQSGYGSLNLQNTFNTQRQTPL